MNTHDIELPPLVGTLGMMPDHHKTVIEAYGQACARTAIELYRQERQSEAEEVCGEAYQVVGILLSDLGIFETDEAEKILDNLSQARMVHKDVLPWQSYDRQRRGEPVAWLRTAKTWDGEPVTVIAKPNQEGARPAYFAPSPDVLAEIDGCFNAAYSEGLADALAETSDARLKDLVERRLLHAHYAVIAAAPQPAAMGENHE